MCFLLDILYDEAGEGKAEDGGGVGDGAVDAGLQAGPGVAGVRLRRVAEVLAVLGTPDADEFPLWVAARLLELLAEGAGEAVAFDLAELGALDLEGVHLERGAHRGEERDRGNGKRVADQRRLAGERVDGVNDVVEAFEPEARRGRLVVDLRADIQFDVGVDGPQSLREHLNLDLSDGLRRGHQLTVDVRDADLVRVDEQQLPHPRADQRLGTPAADAAETEDGNARRLKGVGGRRSEHELHAAEDGRLWHAGIIAYRPHVFRFRVAPLEDATGRVVP